MNLTARLHAAMPSQKQHEQSYDAFIKLERVESELEGLLGIRLIYKFDKVRIPKAGKLSRLRISLREEPWLVWIDLLNRHLPRSRGDGDHSLCPFRVLQRDRCESGIACGIRFKNRLEILQCVLNDCNSGRKCRHGSSEAISRIVRHARIRRIETNRIGSIFRNGPHLRTPKRRNHVSGCTP